MAGDGGRLVVGLTEDQLDQLEAMADGLMIEALVQVCDYYADVLERRGTPRARALTAAVEDVPPVPPGSLAAAGDLAGMAAGASQVIAETMLPLVAEVYLSSASRVRAGLIDAAGGGFSLPAIHSTDAEDYLRLAAPRFDEVGAGLWQTVRGELADGFAAGEGIPELAARVRASAGTSARTATLVARTSVIDASNAGSIQTARRSGLAMEKEWMATPDRRTRPTHRAADGERVGLDEDFMVGGYPCDHPGDYRLPASERNLCRCTVGYVIPEPGADGPKLRGLPGDVKPRQSTGPTYSPIEDRSVIGTKFDPASAMSVADLRAAAAAQGWTIRATTKPDIIREIRAMELSYGRPILPRLPEAAGAPISTPLSAVGRGTEVTDFQVIDGPNDEYVYTAPFGTEFDIDGVRYYVEHAPGLDGSSPEVLGPLDEMRRAHAALPASRIVNRTYRWMLGENPTDPYWRQRFSSPSHSTYASAGNGDVFYWYRTKPGRQRIFLDALRHETGHNVDPRDRPGGSQTAVWQRTARNDGEHLLDVDIDEEIYPDINLVGIDGRPYPRGVTKYGTSSPSEDYAESVMLYAGREVLARGRLPGELDVRDLYFEDLFPARARVLRDRLGDPAAGQAPGAGPRSPVAAADAQSSLDAARGLGDIDYRAGHGATPAAMRSALRSEVRAGTLTQAEADRIDTAFTAGDIGAVRADLDAIARRRGIQTRDRAGEVVEFDPASMQSADGSVIERGARVRVDRQGARQRGRTVIAKTQVTPLSPDDLRAIQTAALVDDRRIAQVVAGLRERGVASAAQLDKLIARSGGLPADVRSALASAVADPAAMTRTVAALLRRRGIKATGTAGRPTPFDAERFKVAGTGDVPGAGDPVKVVKPAYVRVESDGTEVVLTPGEVERIAAKAPKRPKVPDEIKQAQARFTAASREATKGRAALKSPPLRVTQPGAKYEFEGFDVLGAGADRAQKALVQYLRGAFIAINSTLRTGRMSGGPGWWTQDEINSMITSIRQAFDASRLRSPVLVYRGLGTGRSTFGDPADWPDDLTGREWTDSGISSASTSKAVAEEFGEVQLRLVAPQGQRAITLSDSGPDLESEIAFPPGMRYRVIKDHGKDAKGKRRLDVEIVPDGAPPIEVPTPAIRAPGVEAPVPSPTSAATGEDALRAATVPLRTAAERRAYAEYVSDYRYINGQLREGGRQQSAVRRQVAGLDSAMARAELPEPIDVYRVAGTVEFDGGIPTDGAEWVDQGYTSTSVTPKVARRGEVAMRIRVPAGTRAVATPELDVGEVLLSRGMRFRVTHVEGVDDSGVWHVDVEVVPDGVPAPSPVAAVAESPVRAEIRELIEAGGSERGFAGVSEDVKLITSADGRRVIRKRFTTGGVRDADAEELGSLVGDAIGLRTPAVVRLGDREAGIEFIDGETGDQIVGYGQATPDDIIDSDDGRLIGLLDAITRHSDRNPGNWVRTPDGRLAAIDQGAAFQPSATFGGNSEFGRRFVEPDGGWLPNDMSPEDLAIIRRRLEALKPEFVARKRVGWFNAMMTNLRQVERRATGTKRRVPDTEATPVSPPTLARAIDEPEATPAVVTPEVEPDKLGASLIYTLDDLTDGELADFARPFFAAEGRALLPGTPRPAIESQLRAIWRESGLPDLRQRRRIASFLIDRNQGVSSVLAEVDELIAKGVAPREIMTKWLEPRALPRIGEAAPSVADAGAIRVIEDLKRVGFGRMTAARARGALDQAARRAGMRFEHRAGDFVEMTTDRAIMREAGQAIESGQAVRVQTPGLVRLMRDRDPERVRTAEVRPLIEGEAAPATPDAEFRHDPAAVQRVAVATRLTDVSRFLDPGISPESRESYVRYLRQAWANPSTEERAILRAVETGDRQALARALTRRASADGLTARGAPGDVVEIPRAESGTYRLAGDAEWPEGATHFRIDQSGYTYVDADGRVVNAVKPTVTPLGGAAEAAEELGRARRLAEASVAQHRPLADLADELDQALADRAGPATRRALIELVEDLPTDVRDALLRAVPNVTTLRTELARQLAKAGLRRGDADGQVRFNPALHEAVGTPPKPGDLVEVVDAGYVVGGVPVRPLIVRAIDAEPETGGVPKPDLTIAPAHLVELVRRQFEHADFIELDPFDRPKPRMFRRGHGDIRFLEGFQRDYPEVYAHLVREARAEYGLDRFIEHFSIPGTREEIKARIIATMRANTESARVVVRRANESSLRDIIARGRMRTQFETRTSGGDYAPAKRARMEQGTWGYPLKLDPKLRPVYGYLSDLADESVWPVQQYGGIRIVLKNAVRRRTSFVMGDSLGGRGIISELDDPEWSSYSNFLMRDPTKPSNWWTGDAQKNMRYAEAQIHGGVTVDDIDEIIFDTQPSEETIEALAGAGIPWRLT